MPLLLELELPPELELLLLELDELALEELVLELEEALEEAVELPDFPPPEPLLQDVSHSKTAKIKAVLNTKYISLSNLHCAQILPDTKICGLGVTIDTNLSNVKCMTCLLPCGR
jgi:hypothetical protein